MFVRRFTIPCDSRGRSQIGPKQALLAQHQREMCVPALGPATAVLPSEE